MHFFAVPYLLRSYTGKYFLILSKIVSEKFLLPPELRTELATCREDQSDDPLIWSLLVLFASLSVAFWGGRVLWLRFRPGRIYPPDV